MKFKFPPEALEDYKQAVTYYAQRGSPLALRFVEAVEDAILRVTEAPQRCRVVKDDVRRCLTRVFPYGILYTTEDDFVLIVAVMHCSRKPGYWLQRVTER